MLSPPPDLVVSHLEVNDSILTGEHLVVTYTVTNQGAGPTFEEQWTDYVVRFVLKRKILCIFLLILFHH